MVIDIDKCAINGKLNKFVRKIVNKLKSYKEISILGMEIYIVAFALGFVFDKERYYFNNRKHLSGRAFKKFHYVHRKYRGQV